MHFLILSRLWFPLAAALPLPQGLDERRWEDPHPGYAAPDARTVSLLVGQLGARDRRVRARAAWALGEIGQRSYVGELLARGKDESSMVREEVAKALGRIGDGQAVPVLCSLAGDRAPEVRLAAVRSLGVFADPDAVAVLNYLFVTGVAPDCLDAADAADNGRVDISDAAFLLNFLFRRGSYPLPPYPLPGLDPTEDDQDDCEPGRG